MNLTVLTKTLEFIKRVEENEPELYKDICMDLNWSNLRADFEVLVLRKHLKVAHDFINLTYDKEPEMAEDFCVELDERNLITKLNEV